MYRWQWIICRRISSAEYKQQARLNDVICPARAVDENKTTVLLNDQKGEPYAVVEFK